MIAPACEHCKKLDISELLDDHVKTAMGERDIVRYYCLSPESSYDYCPFCGEKERCPYFHDSTVNAANLTDGGLDSELITADARRKDEEKLPSTSS